MNEDDEFWREFSKHITPLIPHKIVPIVPIQIRPQVNTSHVIQELKVPPICVLSRHATHLKAHPGSYKYFKKKTIGARIDLHGHTVIESAQILTQFLMRCQNNKIQFVLIITGKGASKSNPLTPGTLQKFVPKWLADHPMWVVHFSQAAPSDGGSGAFYVHVRNLDRI